MSTCKSAWKFLLSSSFQTTKTRRPRPRIFVGHPSYFFHVWLLVLQWAIRFCTWFWPLTCMSGHKQRSEVKRINKQTVTTHRRSPRVHCSPLNSQICELTAIKTVDDSLNCRFFWHKSYKCGITKRKLSQILCCSLKFEHHYSNSVIWLKHVYSTRWFRHNFTLLLTKIQPSVHIEQLITWVPALPKNKM